jgi:hypothetical protein
MGILSRIKTWAAAETLTASDLNAEFDNILNNLDPDSVEDASANATAMQATADPYPGATESLATDLRGEVQRLRYLLKQITGEAQWYIDPDNDIASMESDINTLQTDVAVSATTSVEGNVELATAAECAALSDTSRAITPSALASLVRYDTIWVPATLMVANTTNGAAYAEYEYPTSDIMQAHFAFDGATQESIQFSMPMPENWDQTNLKFKCFWSTASGSSENDTVSWILYALALGNSDTIDASMAGSTVTIDDVVLAGTSGVLHITPTSSDMTVANYAAGDMVTFYVGRNVAGNDDMTEDAWLFGVLMQYGISTAVSEWS